jgi:glutamyl/glutaminyl-tRNA synthetase
LSADFRLSKEAKKIIKASGNEFFSLAKEAFLKNWPSWTEFMKDLSSTSGKKGKELYQPIRISLTGQESGPKLDQLSTLLGKERVIERLEKASKI